MTLTSTPRHNGKRPSAVEMALEPTAAGGAGAGGAGGAGVEWKFVARPGPIIQPMVAAASM
jgi:hypothetical protein